MKLFTSESVTEGHPDKVADQISDSILDAILEKDPKGRVACETLVTTGQVHVVGEISTSCYVDISKIIRNTIREIGYTDAHYGFDADTVGVLISLDEQSPDIAQGVNEAIEAREGKMDAIDAIGAGDQGLMFGYATNETEEFLPLPISLAHRLARQLAKVRKDGTLKYLRPDGKTQVTIAYDDNGKPVAVDTIVISTQHAPEVSLDQIRADMIKFVIDPIVPSDLKNDSTKIFVNPTGRFVVGGPQGDSGLTGRKIIVDTYGGWARHGGGAFSGKDPTKVDRSASYAARYARFNWHMRLELQSLSRFLSILLELEKLLKIKSSNWSRKISIFVRLELSKCSISSVRFINRQQHMDILDATISICRGKELIKSMH